MRESRYAERLNLELERINTLTIKRKDEPKLPTPMEEEETQKELAPIIELAETIINTDFSGESKIKNSLLQRLLQKTIKQMPHSMDHKPLLNMELSNDDLDRVAGGLTSQQTNGTGCPFCGYQQSSVDIEPPVICPNCGFSRSGNN